LHSAVFFRGRLRTFSVGIFVRAPATLLSNDVVRNVMCQRSIQVVGDAKSHDIGCSVQQSQQRIKQLRLLACTAREFIPIPAVAVA